MTIDKAIEIINHYLDYPKGEVRKALLVAISTMRKYKKIEQIVEDRYGKPLFKFMDAIVKVVEDGKNDN